MVIILINLININTFPSELTLIVTMPLLPEEITFEFARFCTLGNGGLPIGGLSFLFGGILFLER